MYMANNKMSMTDTIFRMNVGSGSVALTDVCLVSTYHHMKNGLGIIY